MVGLGLGLATPELCCLIVILRYLLAWAHHFPAIELISLFLDGEVTSVICMLCPSSHTTPDFWCPFWVIHFATLRQWSFAGYFPEGGGGRSGFAIGPSVIVKYWMCLLCRSKVVCLDQMGRWCELARSGRSEGNLSSVRSRTYEMGGSALFATIRYFMLHCRLQAGSKHRD